MSNPCDNCPNKGKVCHCVLGQLLPIEPHPTTTYSTLTVTNGTFFRNQYNIPDNTAVNTFKPNTWYAINN